MAITYLDSASGAGSGGTYGGIMTAALTNPVNAGDTIIVYTFCGLTGNTPQYVTDDKSQTYTKLAEILNFADHGESGLWALMSSVAGAQTISVELDPADNHGGVVVLRYSGLSFVDQVSSIAQNGATTWASPAITTLSPAELLVGFNFGYLENPTTIASPFTQRQQVGPSSDFDGGNGSQMVIGDYIVSTTQTNITATGATTSGTTNFSGIASFTPGGVTVATVAVLELESGLGSIRTQGGFDIKLEND